MSDLWRLTITCPRCKFVGDVEEELPPGKDTTRTLELVGKALSWAREVGEPDSNFLRAVDEALTAVRKALGKDGER